MVLADGTQSPASDEYGSSGTSSHTSPSTRRRCRNKYQPITQSQSASFRWSRSRRNQYQPNPIGRTSKSSKQVEISTWELSPPAPLCPIWRILTSSSSPYTSYSPGIGAGVSTACSRPGATDASWYEPKLRKGQTTKEPSCWITWWRGSFFTSTSPEYGR